MRPHISMRPTTRSSPRANPVRTGSGATSTRSCGSSRGIQTSFMSLTDSAIGPRAYDEESAYARPPVRPFRVDAVAVARDRLGRRAAPLGRGADDDVAGARAPAGHTAGRPSARDVALLDAAAAAQARPRRGAVERERRADLRLRHRPVG